MTTSELLAHLPSLADYEILDLQGASTAVRARERGTGDVVELYQFPRPETIVEVDRVRRLADALILIDSPHLVPVRRLIEGGDDFVLVSGRAPTVSMASLLARRPALGPGEVVTMGVGLSAALIAAHEVGVELGELSLDNVRLDRHGRPVIAGAGVDQLWRRAWALPEPGEDVRSAVDLCLTALAAGSGEPRRGGLASLLYELRDATHPTAAGLASGLLATVPAEPIRLLGRPRTTVGPDAPPPLPTIPEPHPRLPRRAGGGPVHAGRALPRSEKAALGHRPDRGSSLRASSRAALSVGAALLATGAGFWGVWHDRGAVEEVSQPERPATISDSVTVEWPRVVAELDGARAAAFAAGSASRLAAIYAEGSPAGARDLELMRGLSSAHTRATGLRPTLLGAELESLTGDQAVVTVTDELGQVDLVDRSGSRVSRRPARGRVVWALTLWRSPGGWRVYDVSARAR